MGETAGGSGWHPDPTGRAHLRYFDGTAWTESVSTGVDTWTDPLAAGPGRPDARLLAATELTIAYGPTGLEAPGRWFMTDSTGIPRGSIIGEAHPIDPRYASRYLVLDPVDLVVLTISPVVAGWAPGLAVTDWRGMAVGSYRFPLTSSNAEAMVGAQVVATADPFEDRGAVTLGPGWDAGDPVRLRDRASTTIATVTCAEDRTALRRFYGARKGTFTPDPAQCHLDLVRPPGLPEPLRSLTVAFVAVFAARVHDDRVRQRSPSR